QYSTLAGVLSNVRFTSFGNTCGCSVQVFRRRRTSTDRMLPERSSIREGFLACNRELGDSARSARASRRCGASVVQAAPRLVPLVERVLELHHLGCEVHDWQQPIQEPLLRIVPGQQEVD